MLQWPAPVKAVSEGGRSRGPRWFREPGRYCHSSIGECFGLEVTIVDVDDRGDEGESDASAVADSCVEARERLE